MMVKSLAGSLTAALVAVVWYWSMGTRITYGDASQVRSLIEEAFLTSWEDYEAYGWGSDEYSPLKRTHKNMGASDAPLGWIIVDSLDTMMMMYNSSGSSRLLAGILKAQTWIDNELNYDLDSEVSLFETTIRMLGGLLSAHHWSSQMRVGNEQMYLDKAIDLADRLSMAFLQSKSGIPYSSINLHTGEAVKNHVDGGASSTAEFTTLQLEFKYLSYLTGNKSYWELSEQVYKPLYSLNGLVGPQWDGLAPIYTYPDTGEFRGNHIRFGSRGDSFYEYLLKQYLLTHEKLYYDLYRASIEGMKKHLLGTSKPNGLVYIGEKQFGLRSELDPKMDHLVCFMGGLLAMGATEGLPIKKARKQPFWDTTRESDWKLAQDLTYTCYQMYAQIPTKLSPEIVVFNKEDAVGRSNWISESGDFYVKPADRHNLQRPETVESLMFLYHLTGDNKYRQWGWEIFQGFQQHSLKPRMRRPGKVYTSLKDCIQSPTQPLDNLESFWLAETLKYLHLLFQDDVDLTKIVFNTEAHAFPVLDTRSLRDMKLKTGWSP
ncbi:hypothetical protein ZYGR_0H01880 [Zygosaccharomyces rouxii]|uniref:alpha-1,2-Mannosidase n=2 Tax=Zygosaccharomyces rouxii TaxID=4956 RepID=C5DRG9_ZYGRC|nr:uncharacterized protein ZYRO0B08360g [Zygosaccharomyces rouxii]KAH9200082.1 glycoside hydrolase [Zygosaccharomyces rouxii]GAV47347.1 hypothetical protein ZYGR_0H01880 [Zygosaccharomyces rouxii]CAR26380.1 ZYRO0B08360p [Zygosaccharomyces rouxii]